VDHPQHFDPEDLGGEPEIPTKNHPKSGVFILYWVVSSYPNG
jgi:hypothetical protein